MPKLEKTYCIYILSGKSPIESYRLTHPNLRLKGAKISKIVKKFSKEKTISDFFFLRELEKQQ